MLVCQVMQRKTSAATIAVNGELLNIGLQTPIETMYSAQCEAAVSFASADLDKISNHQAQDYPGIPSPNCVGGVGSIARIDGGDFVPECPTPDTKVSE